MDFNMVKNLSFHFSLDEREMNTFYKLLQKLDFGYGLKIKEFEITEEERDLIDWMDKYIHHSDALKELSLDDEKQIEK